MNGDLETRLRDVATSVTVPLDEDVAPTKARLDQERLWLRATPPPKAPGSYLLVLGRLGDRPHWLTLSQRELVLGRAHDADLVLESRSVSKRHAVLTSDGTDWCIRDTGSTNGVCVNGQPREVAWLASGDILQLGNFLLLFLQVPNLQP